MNRSSINNQQNSSINKQTPSVAGSDSIMIGSKKVTVALPLGGACLNSDSNYLMSTHRSLMSNATILVTQDPHIISSPPTTANLQGQEIALSKAKISALKSMESGGVTSSGKAKKQKPRKNRSGSNSRGRRRVVQEDENSENDQSRAQFYLNNGNR